MSIQQKVICYKGHNVSGPFGEDCWKTPGDQFEEDIACHLRFGWRVISVTSTKYELVVVYQSEEK